ncbi:MAG TPA: MarR family transcriptional regulator [Epulopiscium sp.]|nr:MarR family transcriptional regulator [Candidatus Epulonipiscium sp.]
MDKLLVKEALFTFLQTIYKFEQIELDKFSVSWQEILLLKHLTIHKECNMGLIATTLNIKPFQATRLVDGLIKKQLITRFTSENDRRVKSISITKKGISRLDEVDDFHHLIIENAAKDLGTKHTTEILKMMFYLEKLLGLSNNK